MPEKEKPVKNKKKPLLVFFVITFTIMISFTIITLAFFDSFLKDERNMSIKEVFLNSLKEKNLFQSLFSSLDKKINFVILGVDDDKTRTDFIMIGQFNTIDKKIDLISIPRDMYVEFSIEELKFLKSNNRITPSSNFLKINEIHHYAGNEFGIDFVVNKLEEVFKIKLDYYAKIDLDGFKYLVDELGGIEFDVPQRMFYEDIYQNLYIDLMPGVQILDGKKAEGLIRYRKTNEGYEKISPSYALGDTKRIEVQQAFIKEFLVQLTKKNILNNSQAVIKMIDKYIKTNFNSGDIPKFIKYFKDVKKENFATYSLPTKQKKISQNNIYYVEPLEPNAEELIKLVFFETKLPINPTTSYEKNIQILNGGYTIGLAANKKNMLEQNNFKVDSIGDKKDNLKKNTIIYVKTKGMGEDLVQFFNDPVIETDKNLTTYDIIIVLGTEEK